MFASYTRIPFTLPVYVSVQVANSLYFTREGADVHCDLPISVSQAILGGTVKAKGIYSDHTVTVSQRMFFLQNVFSAVLFFFRSEFLFSLLCRYVMLYWCNM